MSSTKWTEKQTKEVMKKVIRRAEVSRITRLLQHRLALANVKTQNGWENLTLDVIEPKVEEGLKRKRQMSSQEKSPVSTGRSFFSEGDSDLVKQTKSDGHAERPVSQCSDIGPLPNFRISRKRMRNDPLSDFAPAASKRPRTAGDNCRLIQSSPGFHYELKSGYGRTHRSGGKSELAFHSSPPRTPPRRMFKPTVRDRNTGEEGADLLLYLATSPSPAAIMPRKLIPTTPPSHPSVLPSSMMYTPGAPQTPQTGFNFADFVNITPSPAQGAFGTAGRLTPTIAQGRGTPIAQARRRLNFDQLGQPPTSGSPHAPPSSVTRSTALNVDGGSGLVS